MNENSLESHRISIMRSVVADVSKPIIGTEKSGHFNNFSVVVRNRCQTHVVILLNATHRPSNPS